MESIATAVIGADLRVLEVGCEYVNRVKGFVVVGRAESSEAGLELIFNTKPQLTILDIHLPGKNGIDMLKDIRSMNLPTDVIVVTEDRDTATIWGVIRFGAVDCIIKPFEFERVKTALNSYRRLYDNLQCRDALDQEGIDRIIRGYGRFNGDGLPKGLTELTLKHVVLFLSKQRRALSAEEVAKGIGLSRVTARKYLDFLTETGQVKVEPRYGCVGRPLNKYILN